MEEQLLELVKFIEQLQKRLIQTEETNQLLVRSNHELVEALKALEKDFAVYQRNAHFEIQDPRIAEDSFWYPNIRPIEEALAKIVNEHCSIARFGDAEFSVIAGRIRHSYQTVDDPSLRERLLEVLSSDESNLLIGLADNYGSLAKYSEQTKREIRHYLSPAVRAEHLALFDPNKTYYNAYLTRPYIIYSDADTDAPLKRFKALKQIWDGRDCIFAEGKYTRLGVGNNLFDNAKSIKRILSPTKNAFSRYDDILRECLKADKDTLFLNAMGPTATVLTYDLCKAGYQAVDVGHVDLEYEWFLKGEGGRVAIPTKSNNEMNAIEGMEPARDASYEKQIIADFGEPSL